MSLRLFISFVKLILSLLILAPASIYGAIPLSERNALIAFYHATGGENWDKNTGWLGPPGTENSWYGVDVIDDHVVTIRLLGRGLTGGIPGEIRDLPYLEVLDLDLDDWSRFVFPTYNYIETISPEISKLSRLRILNLRQNRISKLPAEIGDLESLEELRLGGNQISSLPPTFGNLSRLVELYLRSNNLTRLPNEFFNLHNLETLDISYNPLGTIPESIAGLRSLKWLFASRAAITDISDSIGLLEKLEILSLRDNYIQRLPSSIGNLSNLKRLNLDGNQLDAIPPEIGRLKKLERLEIFDNKIKSLPAEMGGLVSLKRLYAWRNLIESIPPELGQLKNLELLYLNGNRLSGQIPESLSNLNHLERIDLGFNQLSGPFPTALTKLKNVSSIDLENNRLSGPLPPQIGDLSGNMAGLRISGNNFSGPFPFEIRVLGGLSYEYNALEIHDPAVQTYIDNHNPSWNYQKPSQTLPPDDLRIKAVSPGNVALEWETIYFTEYPGGYEVFYGETSGGDFQKVGTVPDKSVTTYQVTGLNPEKDHYFQVRSYTDPHEFNQNRVVSGFSNQVSTKAESEIRYYVPVIRGDAKTYTGMAFSNSSMQKSHFELAAIGSGGSITHSFAESNRQELNPGAQFSGLTNEIFGFNPGASVSGWVEFSADNDSFASLFQIGTKKSLDGGLAFKRTLSKFFFTRVNGIDSTGSKQPKIYLALANPNRESATVRLRLYSGSPTAIETNQTLPPRGSLFATLQEIFGTFEPEVGFIEAFIVDGGGIVGVQVVEYSEEETMIILPARDDTSGKFGYSAQLASGLGWFTSVNLSNVGFSQRTVTIEAIRDDGSPLDSPVEITLRARRGFQSKIRDLFDFSSEFHVGSLKITADGPQVLADVIFGDPELNYAAAMPLQKRGFETAWCSHVASSETLYTGIALFNISPGKAVVSIEVFAKDGIKIGETSIELKAGHRISRLISELIPSIENLMGGSIRITSTRPIIGQQFFGDRSGNYLSSVPPVY